MAELKPYPAYKDSGIEWLGEIPKHWEVKPIRVLANPGYRTFTDGDWIEAPFITNAGIRLIQTGNIGIGHFRDKGFRYISDQTFRVLKCTEVKPGNVLICRLADPVGRACLAPDLGGRMITSVDVCILRPKRDIDPGFVVYALSASDYLAYLGAICRGGTRDRVSRSMLGSIGFRQPPLLEQRRIAAFLDRETARIDALVAKKERLIELLQEKRTALISHAVTKGLDPDVPMKDSGVEWLGEIPAHWELKRIKGLLVSRKGAIKTGPFGSHLHSSEMMDSEIKVFNQRTVIDRDIFSGLNYISMDKFNELRAFESFPGDLLVTARGTIGRCMIVPREAPRGILHPCLLRIQIDKRLAYDHYIELLIEESGLILEQLKFMSNSTTIEVIYSDSLKETLFPIPPLLEQRTIAAFLDRETAKIDALVAKVREAIDHLKELRTTLISAAVTGKIDVRQAAA